MQFSKIDISDIYPVFYKFYDDHPIGTAVLHNYERSPAQNVKVSVFVKEYMTDPKEIDGPTQIDRGRATRRWTCTACSPRTSWPTPSPPR